MDNIDEIKITVKTKQVINIATSPNIYAASTDINQIINPNPIHSDNNKPSVNEPIPNSDDPETKIK